MTAVSDIHFKQKTVLTILIGLLLGGLSVGMLPATKAAASANCPSGYTYCYYKWKIVGKTPIARRQGNWRVCVSWVPSGRQATVTCSIGRTTTNTVTTGVTGSIHVGYASLSQTVGYDVSHTYSVSASYSTTVGPRSTGNIQWAPIFANRYDVRQQRIQCLSALRLGEVCNVQAVYADAFTEKFDHPVFRVVIK